VWVNGVKATLNGTNWTAVNVPVNGLGTTVFEALAITNTDHNGNGTPGTGGGGTNSTLQNPGNPVPAALSPVAQAPLDEQPAIICTKYSSTIDVVWTVNGTNWTEFGYIVWDLTNDTYSQWAWAFASSGHYWNYEWCNYDDPNTGDFLGFSASKQSWDPFGNGSTIGYWSDTNGDYSQPYETNVSFMDTSSFALPPEESYYQFTIRGLSSSDGPLSWLWPSLPAVYTVSRNVATSYSLRTGGKAASGRTALFELAVTATTVKNLGTLCQTYVPVPYSQIKVMGQALGADANRWVIEPDGISVPVPVQVPGSPSFFFNIIPTKYKAFFTAYVDMPGPPPSHVTHIGTDYGHAWWMLSSEAPVAGIRAALGTTSPGTPPGIEFLGMQVGYADHGHPRGPGMLRVPETNRNISESKQFQIGFGGLLAALAYTQEVDYDPGTYNVLLNNCVQHVVSAGAAAGLSLPHDTQPESFGWDLINSQ